MKNIINTLIAVLLILNIFPDEIIAQRQLMPKRKLIVGTKEAPPFSMKAKDGTWKGISIDLWSKIANENLSSNFKSVYYIRPRCYESLKLR